MNLKTQSIAIIKNNQTKDGAFLASPNFENYRYCWLRDGSFIAFAMDVSGESDTSERFFRWVDRTIKRYSFKVDDLVKKKNLEAEFLASDFLPARFTMDGFENDDDWGNFQLDGYGTWLWALTEHMKRTGNFNLMVVFGESIHTTVTYLINFWKLPNYDCWEENGDKIHTSTLACIYGGLASINQYLNDSNISKALTEIKAFVHENCILNDRLIKYIGTDEIDASLLWTGVPFNITGLQEQVMLNTVKEIEAALVHGCGAHRYKQDSYYGGGEWILLSAWLGWYYCKIGKVEQAKKILEWIEGQADENGELPEQVFEHVNKRSYIKKWTERWGPVAKPLLWSHGMYLVLYNELNQEKSSLTD